MGKTYWFARNIRTGYIGRDRYGKGVMPIACRRQVAPADQSNQLTRIDRRWSRIMATPILP